MMAAAVLAAAPLHAQPSNASTAAPPSSDIGPGELSNFSLNGTVTRPAEQPPATQPATEPQPATPGPAPAATTRSPAPARDGRAQPPVAPAPAESDLFRRPPTLPDASSGNAVTAAPATLPLGDGAPSPALASEGFSLLPWIVALLAVAGMAFMYFGRQRRGRAAGHAPIDLSHRPMTGVAPRPDPVPRDPVPGAAPPGASAGSARRPLPTTLMPPPAAPRAQPGPIVQPKPDPLIPGGIVSTSLRPWIDIDLTPDRALLDEQGTAIAFEVTLFNSGNAAARDVIVEARLLNAGASQDVELSAFFAAATQPGDPIPQIAPYARIPLRSAVRLTRGEIREYEIEGRKLFVPLIAISVRYRWSSGEGQSAAGFLVGQSGEGKDKLAPLRLDKGDRSWKGLGVRRYEKGLRS
jgi:hypothetical protein